MNLHVLCKFAFLLEMLITMKTLEVVLVNSLVQHDVVFLFKAFATKRTLKVMLIPMSSLVEYNRMFSCEMFSTKRTHE